MRTRFAKCSEKVIKTRAFNNLIFILYFTVTTSTVFAWTVCTATWVFYFKIKGLSKE